MEINFGYLNDIVKTAIAENINDKKTKKIFREYVSLIKNNETLKSQFLLFNNINQQSNSIDFIKENINLMLKTHTTEMIKESNMLLYSFIQDKGLNVNINKSKLHENVGYILSNEKNLSNLLIFEKCLSEISNLLTESKNEKTSDCIDCDFDEELTNEEIELLSNVYTLSEEELKELFDNERKTCIEKTNKLFNESTDLDVKFKLLTVKDKLLEEAFNYNTFINDYLNLKELNQNLSE